ncbi:MAG: AMP-binding protein, partial [Leptolyngbyaceae cyanobacterium SM1_3_5]|nr:AMP-binding protein [Leptolyngbyaceae cyanobacterium SM1_3_5]
MPPVAIEDLTWSVVERDRHTAKFDLTLEMAETPTGFSALLEYDCDLFEAATIERMAGHLQTLLDAIAAQPTRRLSDLPLLTAIEQADLTQWNQTQADYPQTTIHQLFEAQVERSPDAVALIHQDQQITYGELNARANQLAHTLRGLNVHSERVGICVERSIELAIGLLGILKAGAAYVPIDPKYPRERSDFMLRNAGVKVLVVSGEGFDPHPLALSPWGEGEPIRLRLSADGENRSGCCPRLPRERG